MRKSALGVMVVFVFLAAPFLAGVKLASGVDVVEDSWTALAPQPSNGYIGCAAVDRKIFSVCITSSRAPGQSICQRYDPDTNTWSTVAPPPTSNSWGTVVACQNKIFLIGGVGAYFSEHVPTQVYDPSTDRWENRTSIPKTLSGQAANVVDGKIYVMGGMIPSAPGVYAPSDANYVYDPANDSWSTMASIPTPVGGCASAVLDEKIYIIGGGPPTDYHHFDAATLVQIFDPKTNQWTIGKPLPTGVYGARACSTSGLLAPKQIYVIGGRLTYSSGVTSADLNPVWTNLNQVYDVETGKWSSAASTPEVYSRFSLVNIYDALYLVGGVTERYIPIGYKADSLPTASPTASSSPAPDGFTINSMLPILTAIVLIVAISIAGLAVYRRKFKG